MTKLGKAKRVGAVVQAHAVLDHMLAQKLIERLTEEEFAITAKGRELALKHAEAA